MENAILEVKNINKAFGDDRIHRGVSFNLHRGESLGLLGGSGSGKSVLLRSLIGLEFIDEGEIYFNKEKIDSLNEEELFHYRIKISYSFQSGALFDSINVYENIAFPLYEHTKLNEQEIQERVQEVLEIIKLADKGHLMPSDLSGGMQKRVGMARSMILEPEIILYDEPTAGLDPTNTQNVIELMATLKKKGIASIFVTHDIPAALKICDRILILKDGKIAYEGTPKEMVNTTNPIVKDFFINLGKQA